MGGKFIVASEAKLDTLDWGRIGFLSNPPSTGAAQLTVIEGKLYPGKGHNFHKHPHQEEVIFVVTGRIEQWIDQEKRVLGPGDAAFIPPDMVHASFNANEGESHILAILSPCVTEAGIEMIDMSAEAPWSGLRG